jgi:putative membrane protein
MGYLSEAEHDLVSNAVKSAELTTAGEIVPVVTDRSDGYSDVALAWAAIVAFTAIAFLAVFPDFYLGLVDRLTGGWNSEWTARGRLSLALAVGVLKFAGMWLIQLWKPLKFLLIPGPIKSARVRGRAVQIFKAAAERRTHGRTGVLIYLSMDEHRAEIVADEAIAAKVAPEVWGEAMAAMLAEIKQAHVGAGMAAAVEQVGAVLAEHFPRAEDDRNELPDRLIEL